jgi:hypothetical protein
MSQPQYPSLTSLFVYQPFSPLLHEGNALAIRALEIIESCPDSSILVLPNLPSMTLGKPVDPIDEQIIQSGYTWEEIEAFWNYWCRTKGLFAPHGDNMFIIGPTVDTKLSKSRQNALLVSHDKDFSQLYPAFTPLSSPKPPTKVGEDRPRLLVVLDSNSQQPLALRMFSTHAAAYDSTNHHSISQLQSNWHKANDVLYGAFMPQ